MKALRTVRTIASTTLVVALLAGCGQTASTSADGAGAAVTSVDAASVTSADATSGATSTQAGTMTMREYLGGRYASYDLFDEGIQSGTNVPPRLEVYTDGGLIGFISDQATIVEAWNELSALTMDAGASTTRESKEGSFGFGFDSGRELIAFDFRTSAYASFVNDECIPMTDPAAVEAIYERLSKLAQASAPEVGTELVAENDAYFWDANADGTLEHMWIDFNNNGDEALSNMILRVFGGDLDVSGYLDGAYGVERVTLMEDERGPYVTIDYVKGDFYSHDTPARATVRLEGDQLVVEELS